MYENENEYMRALLVSTRDRIVHQFSYINFNCIKRNMATKINSLNAIKFVEKLWAGEAGNNIMYIHNGCLHLSCVYICMCMCLTHVRLVFSFDFI